ncbi:polyprenyl synthetase family protein [Nocardioides sp. Bht2]|uniref:polyprenyl synthetase family protein n=1 Tax=Nocardioides sp. Bht2 TaxID=3392297 RepID=UPI0039B56AC4
MTAPAFDDATFRADLQGVIDTFLAAQAERLAPLGDDAAALLAEARTALRGGKRLRAAFCWWGYSAIAEPAASDRAALLRACAALEFLQASALVHDDLMDASDTRRGRPATHKAFEASHQADGWTGDPVQYGAAAAILLGDLLLTWADELLRRCGLEWERVRAALDLFDLCRSEVVAGQFLDVSVQARAKADVATAMTVLRYKSAKYSVERPLHIGAALAGASAEQISALTGYGLPLGEAFQLRDDQLGVFGDPEVTGKPAGDDLVEGKRTVLVAMTLDAAAPADAELLDRSLGRDLDVTEVEQLRALIRNSGAEQQVEELIDELTAQSLAALADPGLRREATPGLKAMAEAATRRVV